MNITEINQLTVDSLDSLSSDAYRVAFDDPITGKAFIAKVEALESGPRPRRGAGSTPPAAEQAPVPTGFDPSFDDAPPTSRSAPKAAAPAATEQTAAPAATEQPATEPTLSIWRYQPKDAQGRNLGAEQVFKYDPTLPVEDPRSLASQLTKAHTHATIALRSKKLEQTIASLSVSDTPFEEPRLLDEAAHPDAAAINALTESALSNGVLSALNVFQTRHPEYKPSNEAAAALIQAVMKSKKNPADPQSWDECWAVLKSLLTIPVVTAAPVVETKAAALAQPSAGLSTGLSNVDSFNHEIPVAAPAAVSGQKLVLDGKAIVVTTRDLDRMDTNLQKRLMRNPDNCRKMDILYAQQEQEKAARRVQGRR
jgi:hypothetical protein